MSKFVKIQTELREPQFVKQALDDLRLRHEQDAAYVHPYSRQRVQAAFVVHAPGADFALAPNREQVLELLGDDMQMAAVRSTLQKIQQRYAYHMVLAEAAKAGFDLVEEQTGRDQVIRMTVRRWA